MIFDKDGTIICFTSLYFSWMNSFIDSVEKKCNRNVRQAIYDTFGYCTKSKKFVPGPGYLCEITMQQARINATETLTTILGEDEAQETIEECWTDSDKELGADQLRLTCDATLFGRLRKAGLKVAMCTNDTRARALLALEHFQITQDFDLIVAHGDKGFEPKPNPKCVLRICERMDVAPDETVMIGDTRADTEMGKKAQLGCTIGVLSGVGLKDDLHHADIILETCDDLLTVYPDLY